MDHSFSREVVSNGRRYTIVRPARRFLLPSSSIGSPTIVRPARRFLLPSSPIGSPTIVRPARRFLLPSSSIGSPPRRDPRADEVRDYMGRRIRDEYVLPAGPKRARVAASTEAIQRLLRDVRAGDAASQTECAVCLQDYAAEETVKAMPVCAHAFHHHCITEWLSRNTVCPICRHELPLPTRLEQEEEEQQQDSEEDEHGEELELEESSRLSSS